MMSASDASLNRLFSLLFQAHPWHGVAPGSNAPDTVNVYVEIVPTDVSNRIIEIGTVIRRNELVSFVDWLGSQERSNYAAMPTQLLRSSKGRHAERLVPRD